MPIRFTPGSPMRGGKWTARPLSGIGLDPVTMLTIAEKAEEAKGKSVFDIFGPTEEFQSRQAIRYEYQGLAGQFRRMVPSLPLDLKAMFTPYLAHIDTVILRGATAADLPDIKGKLAELQAMMMAARPAGVAPGVDFAMAGFPWYVWLIAAGILLPMVIKKK